MNADIPKQFLLLLGKPVLMHTIFAFYNSIPEINIIVVLPQKQFEYWNNLCDKYNFNIKHKIIEGGPTRFHSVKKGLSLINEESIIAIHDGVRPLIKKETIEKSFAYAERYGNAVPTIPINDSVRIVDGTINKVIDRNKLRIIQTPQTFKSKIIKRAYAQNYSDNFTDDATVVESIGEEIHLFDGDLENIKITNPVDLKIAEILLYKSKNIDSR